MKKEKIKIISLAVISIFLITSIPVQAFSNDLYQNSSLDDLFDITINKDTDWYYKPNNYAELVSWYQALEVNFSDYLEVFKANDLYGTGQAAGGYDLYYVRITNESTGFHKPEILMLGSPHGDETAGTIGLYWFADWLMRMAYTDEPCSDYSKEWLRWLIDNREIYIGISQNPYGFDHGPQRYDGNGWDLNREADHDGPGSPTGGIWGSENGKTLRKFVDNHTVRIGSDMHAGVRCLIYPWASTNLDIYGTSQISGYTNQGAPPDFYFYDASALRLGAYMGNCCGDGVFNQYNVQTVAEYLSYSAYGAIMNWAYAADVEQNPAEDQYVEDETFGNYPGTGALWVSPEMSWTKNVPEYEMGNDTTDGWGTEIRRLVLHQADLAQPYVRWQDGTVENHYTVQPGNPVSFKWQVNGSVVVDHTSMQWGVDPNPISSYDFETSDYDENEGNYVGGTGWDGALDGDTSGVIYCENITINTPGEYYFVAKAQVDQMYADVLEPERYGDDSYLRLVKERTNESYYEVLDGTDGVEEIIGQTWWYSPVIHITVGSMLPYASYTWEDADGTGPGTIIHFDASTSTAENITLYEWDWTSDGFYDYSSPDPITSYDYGDDSAYDCTLRITDNISQTDTFTDTVQANLNIDVNQSAFDRGFPIRHTWDGDWGAAQNFTATVNTLTKCEIYLRKFGTPEFNLTVELRKDHPEGTLLDTLSFTPEEILSSWQWLTLDFDDIEIESEENLFIVLPPAPSGVSTSFGFEWGYAFGDQYQPGSFWFTRDGGELWRDLPTRYEFTFITFGN